MPKTPHDDEFVSLTFSDVFPCVGRGHETGRPHPRTSTENLQDINPIHEEQMQEFMKVKLCSPSVVTDRWAFRQKQTIGDLSSRSLGQNLSNTGQRI